MSDLTDLRRRAVHQAQTGNYWAGKCVGLIDQLARVGPAVDQMWRDHHCQRPDLEAIVRSLTEKPPLVWVEDYTGAANTCGYCQDPDATDDPSEHEAECPWRRAVEWVRDTDQETT